MINIKLYKNGFKIKGHARADICSEVSCMSWAYANSIYHVDETSQLYQSAIDNKENPNEGYSWMTFDTKHEKASWLYEEYKHNIKLWVKDMNRTEVQIEEVNEVLDR